MPNANGHLTLSSRLHSSMLHSLAKKLCVEGTDYFYEVDQVRSRITRVRLFSALSTHSTALHFLATPIPICHFLSAP